MILILSENTTYKTVKLAIKSRFGEKCNCVQSLTHSAISIGFSPFYVFLNLSLMSL